MLPVIFAVGMSVITPYATGPGLAYYESGNLPAKDFWRLKFDGGTGKNLTMLTDMERIESAYY